MPCKCPTRTSETVWWQARDLRKRMTPLGEIERVLERIRRVW